MTADFNRLCLRTSSGLLGIGLLKQGTPELIAFLRVQKEELSIFSGETIINNNIHPLSILPDLSTKKTQLKTKTKRRDKAHMLKFGLNKSTPGTNKLILNHRKELITFRLIHLSVQIAAKFAEWGHMLDCD